MRIRGWQDPGMLLADVARASAVVGATRSRAAKVAIGLRVLRPVQPMLATSAASVAEAIGACGLSSVEWKLDGARIQAHHLGSEVRLFTRNLNDVTARLPGVVETMARLPVTQVVLDGEVLATGADDRPDLFQDTMSRFGRHAGGGSHGAELGVWFFDCLHVDGQDLLDEPLMVRAAALATVAGTPGEDARPGRTGRRMGPWATPRPAVQPPPGGPSARATGRQRHHGRHDVQEPHRRRAGIGPLSR